MTAPASNDLAPPAQLASVLRILWEGGERPDTLSAVARHPQLREDRVAYIDLAFLEFLLRHKAGENLEIDAYCALFPDIQASLRLSIDAYLMVADAPSMIPG